MHSSTRPRQKKNVRKKNTKNVAVFFYNNIVLNKVKKTKKENRIKGFKEIEINKEKQKKKAGWGGRLAVLLGLGGVLYSNKRLVVKVSFYLKFY